MEPMPNWHETSVLVTGGTGSFGNKFVEIMLQKYDPKRLVVFSRDELKQSEMVARFDDHPKLRFFIGDVRDRDRLERAMHGIEVVKRVIAISTDKAVNPINLYGATKLCAEKLVVQANVYGHPRGTVCAVVRYGNVIGSRGSVIPLFRSQRATGTVTVTDPSMTRFWIRLEQGVEFAIRCAGLAQGGEIFVPKIPSMRMMDLAETMAPGCEVELIGIRPGEKLHEILLSEDESRQAVEYDDMFVLEPLYPSWAFTRREGGKGLEAGFRYSSDTNQIWFTRAEMEALADA